MNAEDKAITAGSGLYPMNATRSIDGGLDAWTTRDTLSGGIAGAFAKSGGTGLSSDPGHSGQEPPAVSEDNWRRPTRWRDCFFAWRDGDTLQGLAGQLITIGPRSALILAAYSPEPTASVHFCLEGFDEAGWVRARVAGCEPSFNRTRVQLDFHPVPCPPEVLLAALQGSA